LLLPDASVSGSVSASESERKRSMGVRSRSRTGLSRYCFVQVGARRVRAPGLQRRGMGCRLTLLRLEVVFGL
jgi:hypothetical protein